LCRKCDSGLAKSDELEVHSVVHLPPTTVFRRLKSSKPRVAASTGAQYQYVGFSRRKKFRVAVHTLCEKAIRFRRPDYDPDRARKLISSSMSRHLSTRKMSSKSMDAFLSNLANRQDKQSGQSHLPPPLSEVNKCKLAALTYDSVRAYSPMATYIAAVTIRCTPETRFTV